MFKKVGLAVLAMPLVKSSSGEYCGKPELQAYVSIKLRVSRIA